MSIPPILIGLPVAFFPVPIPQTLFAADALPAPTLASEPELAAVVTTVVASTAARTASTKAALRKLIAPPLFERCPLFDEPLIPSPVSTPCQGHAAREHLRSWAASMQDTV